MKKTYYMKMETNETKSSYAFIRTNRLHIKYNEGHNIMIKGSIHQENTEL